MKIWESKEQFEKAVAEKIRQYSDGAITPRELVLQFAQFENKCECPFAFEGPMHETQGGLFDYCGRCGIKVTK